MAEFTMGYIDKNLVVGALAANTSIESATRIDSARINGIRMIRLKAWIAYEGKTTAEGGVIYGLNINPEGNVGDIIEFDPQSSNDAPILGPQQRVITLGYIPKNATSQGSDGQAGPPIFDGKIMWSIPEGEGMNVWAYNRDNGALSTGLNISYFLEYSYVWLRD